MGIFSWAMASGPWPKNVVHRENGKIFTNVCFNKNMHALNGLSTNAIN